MLERVMSDRFPVPTLDVGLRLASQEVSDLLNRLEPTLTTQQRSLVHELRLASETLGAVRSSYRLSQR
jgi:hypothetical protein